MHSIVHERVYYMIYSSLPITMYDDINLNWNYYYWFVGWRGRGGKK